MCVPGSWQQCWPPPSGPACPSAQPRVGDEPRGADTRRPCIPPYFIALQHHCSLQPRQRKVTVLRREREQLSALHLRVHMRAALGNLVLAHGHRQANGGRVASPGQHLQQRARVRHRRGCQAVRVQLAAGGCAEQKARHLRRPREPGEAEAGSCRTLSKASPTESSRVDPSTLYLPTPCGMCQ